MMEQGSWAIIHICTVRTARHDAAKKGWSRGRGLLYIFVLYGRPDMMLLRRDGAGVVGYFTYLYCTDGQIGCC